jgi:signal transduction histidine kinase
VLVLLVITVLRRAYRIRRDFVAIVSHDLRTPLTAVRGYVEALLDGGTEQADWRRFLEIIGRHTLRMERLVRDLLRLARLDAGQEALEHVLCSVDSLFAGIETDLASTIEARRQVVERRIAADASTLSGDPRSCTMLHQPPRKRHQLFPGGWTHHPCLERRDRRIRLTVTDDGPGIPEADLPRIFERFYRVDKARSRGGRDPGGPASASPSRHLIELHGGTARAVNRPEGGAVFIVELPQHIAD